MTTEAGANVFIDPDPASWRRLLHSASQRHPESNRVRAQLGLPSRAPLILTGHQATFWHAGILAKYLAAEAAAVALGCEVAWLIVDQDEQDFGALDVPTTGADGLLRRVTLRLAPAPPIDAATASCPAFEPLAPSADIGRASLSSIAAGISSVIARLHAHRDQPNAARQVAMATSDLLAEFIHRRPMVFATDLSGTDLMRDLVARMQREPQAMADAYNRAALAHPDARVAPLKRDGSRVELPLWRLQAGAPRLRVWSDDALLAGALDLAPRALLMTGLLRIAGCELFIHGRGGGAYDRITDAWLGAWLGVSLAPSVVVSADMQLPLGGADISAKDVVRAKWSAHRAIHDPAILGDPAAAKQKAQWLDRIAQARDAGQSPLPMYQEMHRSLQVFRDRQSSAIAALRESARQLERGFANTAIARDRTWAFPLHDPKDLRRLRDQIFESFGLNRPQSPSPATTLSRPS